MPVLTKQAIKGTGLVENSQIFITILRTVRVGKLGIASSRATGADPICHAIGGQRVIIPTNVGIVRRGDLELVCLVKAQPTIASTPWC
jgi:hypothetical protein